MPIVRDFSNYFTQVNEAVTPAGNNRAKYSIEHELKPSWKDNICEMVLRFLPSNQQEFKPFVENRTHMFQVSDGNWFGCDCLEKFGKECPICKYNKLLYVCGKYTKEEARGHRLPNARKRYISNVYVVKNPNAPETEGHVFRFSYGVQIFNMIHDVMNGYEDPEEGHVEGFNPFDYKTGANFVYSGAMGSNGPKLDKSHFGKPRPISNGTRELTDEEIEQIDNQLYTLDEYDRKEVDVRTFNEIVEVYRNKTGKYLFEPFIGTAVEIPDIQAHDIFDTVPNTTVQIEEPIVNVEQPKTESEPVKVESEDDFFAQLQ